LISIDLVQKVRQPFLLPPILRRNFHGSHGRIVRATSEDLRNLLVALTMNLNRIADSEQRE